MARTSKLTEAQWLNIQKRLLDGESGRSLAEEYGLSETAIRKRLSSQTKEIKDVANQIVATESAFRELSISSQIQVRTLADRMASISNHFAGAAEYGAATSHRLNGLANARAALIPDVGTMDDNGRTAMAEIMALTKIANDASQIGLNLIRANKEQIEEHRQREKEAKASAQEFKASNSADAAIAYQQLIGSGS